MQTNEFEKQVQKQMEDLELNPSASVWEKVEHDIRKRKRRRVLVYYILPLAIGLLGLSVYLFVNNQHQNGLTQEGNAANEKSAADSKDEQSLNRDQQTATNPSKDQPVSPDDQANLSPGKKDNPVKDDVAQKQKVVITDKQKPVVVKRDNDLDISTTNPAISSGKNKKEMAKNDKPSQKKNDPVSVLPDKVTQDDGMKVTVDQPPAGNIAQNDKSKNADQPVKPVAGDVTIKSDVIIKDAPVSKSDSAKKEDIAQTDKKDTPAAKKKRKDAKFKWGVEAYGGVTSNADASFSFTPAARMADNLYNSPSSLTSANLPYALHTASPIDPGAAFRLGVTSELKLSEKIRISAGLRYAYASNHIKVGMKSDSLVTITQINNGRLDALKVNEVYSGPQKRNYTNSYHFIQLPVAFHWQINKGKKIPAIQWDAGMSVAYLLATNALLYDPGYNGIYYHNKKAFNKTHMNLGTGLSVRLASKNGKELVIGPELSLDMSKVVKTGYDRVQYFLYGGVNAKMLFSKKKK